MMEMQEIKERRRAPAPDADTVDAAEVDPAVPPTSSLLGEEAAAAARRRKRSSIEVGVSYVFDRLWSLAFFTVACFGLYETQFVHEVLYAAHANRTFVALFIASCSLVVLFGCYIEIYRNLVLGEKVSYETAKTATHGMLFSMVLAGFFFTIGMWPVWGWLTVPYLFMWFWGVIVQAVVIFPVQAQRVIFGVGYVWFMHSYLSLFVL